MQRGASRHIVLVGRVPIYESAMQVKQPSISAPQSKAMSASSRQSGSSRLFSVSAALTLVLMMLDACVSTTAPAAGSYALQMTTDPSDVSTCTAVGEIKVPGRAPNKDVQFRNQAFGFGADTALVTVFGDATPVDGIAYRCPHS